MNSIIFEEIFECADEFRSMHAFGEEFIEAFPRPIENLKIPGRMITTSYRKPAVYAQVDQVADLQKMLAEVLSHEFSLNAHDAAERAFFAFLSKQGVDEGMLRFFNGWNETHKTTSLVSAKTIMRLSVDAFSIPADRHSILNTAMAHLHEVAKDDYGLGQRGHDGMYSYMTSAFGAVGWEQGGFSVGECNEFSTFLYDVGVAEHKSPLGSLEYQLSIMEAMMVSIASELWNGREFNFISQFIQKKLLSVDPSLASDTRGLRNAVSYVVGHSGEVENKHGLHALAAAQAFGHTVSLPFNIERLKQIMLEYTARVGRAFSGLHHALTRR